MKQCIGLGIPIPGLHRGKLQFLLSQPQCSYFSTDLLLPIAEFTDFILQCTQCYERPRRAWSASACGLLDQTSEQRTKVAERYWAKLQPRLPLRWQWVSITKHNAIAADPAGDSVRMQPPHARYRTVRRAKTTSEEADALQPALTALFQPPEHRHEYFMMIVAFRLCAGTLERLARREKLVLSGSPPKPSILRKLLSFSSNTSGPRDAAAPVDNLWINLLSPAPAHRQRVFVRKTPESQRPHACAAPYFASGSKRVTSTTFRQCGPNPCQSQVAFR